MSVENLLKKWRYWLPSTVLVTVALHQQYHAHFHELTPWKGGGFGMFSTVDSRGARFIKFYSGPQLEAKKIPKPIPKKQKERLRAYASEKRFLKLASDLKIKQPDSFLLELWKFDFDKTQSKLIAVKSFSWEAK